LLSYFSGVKTHILLQGIWTEETPVEKKLHGSLEDVRCTASFAREAGVSI
jgi:hypothetical protein